MYLLWHTPEVIGGDVQLLEGLQAAQGEGELLQAVVGQREGHKMAEEVEVSDPPESPRLTQHGSITAEETLLLVVCV